MGQEWVGAGGEPKAWRFFKVQESGIMPPQRDSVLQGCMLKIIPFNQVNTKVLCNEAQFWNFSKGHFSLLEVS